MPAAGKKKRKLRGAGSAAAGGNPPEQPKQQQQHRPLFSLSSDERAEEVVALQAIFGSDLEVHEDGAGFNLRVIPHPGELVESYVSIQLQVRWAPGV